MSRLVLWFLLLSSFPFIINAQNTKFVPQRVIEAKEILKDGVIIMQLKSDQNKLEAMEKLINDENTDDNTKERIKKQMDEAQASQQTRNKQTILAFKENFSAAKVHFIYDYDAKPLLDGNYDIDFLDEVLNPIDGPDLSSSSFLIMKIGGLDRATTTGAESLMIIDHTLTPLPSPFPGPIKFNGIEFLFNNLIDRDYAYEKNILKISKKLNERIERFLETD